jgi:hypothetical protein
MMHMPSLPIMTMVIITMHSLPIMTMVIITMHSLPIMTMVIIPTKKKKMNHSVLKVKSGTVMNVNLSVTLIKSGTVMNVNLSVTLIKSGTVMNVNLSVTVKSQRMDNVLIKTLLGMAVLHLRDRTLTTMELKNVYPQSPMRVQIRKQRSEIR